MNAQDPAQAWIQTYTGRKFFPLAPRAEDVDMEDIAHALSLQCRYGGHVDRFYSVAEHSILLSYAVPMEHALWALLHDATETYVVDVPSPLKRHLDNYASIEQRVMDVLVTVFSLSPATMPAEVHEADVRIRLNERNALMSMTKHQWGMDGTHRPLDLPVQVTGWPPRRAESDFLARYEQLAARLPADGV